MQSIQSFIRRFRAAVLLVSLVTVVLVTAAAPLEKTLGSNVRLAF